MMILLSKLLPIFFYPVGLAIEFAIAAMVMHHRKKPRGARICITLSLLTLLLFSNQFMSDALVRSLENKYSPISPTAPIAAAIVILGGGMRSNILPRLHVEFSEQGDRLIEGWRLYRAQAAPLIIPTGGGIDFIQKGKREGDEIRDILIELGVPNEAIIPENESRNTHENALFVRKLMDEKGIGKEILLVTSALHMPRSVAIFQKEGFNVIPAPADYIADLSERSWYALLPNVENLDHSTQAIREWKGIVVYKMLGWI